MNTDSNDPQKRPLIDNSGFTLLEIIAVLVIMSILAVVAVPKYFDLQDQARQKALGTGVAEAVGRVNGYFAEQVLSDVRPINITYSDDTLGTDLGDFTLSVNAGSTGATSGTTNGDIILDITGRVGTPVAGLTAQKSVPRPGF